MRHGLSVRALMYLLLFSLAACGGGGGGGQNPGGGGVNAPSGLSYPSPQVLVVGAAANLSATVTGTVTGYSVSPALPAGISLNTTSGAITGAPTSVAANATYTVTASNSAGSTTFALRLTVNPAAPGALNYSSPQNLQAGQPIANLTPSVTGTVATYAVLPALPAGLSLNTTTGVISGTPTTETASAAYTVTASNVTGSTTFALTIAVSRALAPPTALSYPSPRTAFVGLALTPLTPTVTGTVTAYAISPALPSGLSFNTTTGVITGIPVQPAAAATYTIQASNADGDTTFGLNLTVTLSAATLTVTPGYKRLTLNWSEVPGASIYRVLMSNGGAFTQQGGDLTVRTLTQADLDWIFVDWDTRRYVIRACDGAFCSNSAEVGIADLQTPAIRYIKPDFAVNNDRYGSAIALGCDGYCLAIGARLQGDSTRGIVPDGGDADGLAPFSGAVFYREYSRGTGTQLLLQIYIKASNADALDRFGTALALSGDGNTLVVGAPYEASNATGINGNQANNSMPGAGAVYVFTRNAGSWIQQAYIKASNPNADDLFGLAVALSHDGSVLVVGAPAEDSAATGINGDAANNAATNAGAAYVFRRANGVWAQEAYLKASNTEAGDMFGSSVAIDFSGLMVAVGAISEDSNAPNQQTNNMLADAGAVYTFARGTTAWGPNTYVKAFNPGVGDQFGAAVALSPDGLTLMVGAPFEDSSTGSASVGPTSPDPSTFDDAASNAGAVYTYTKLFGFVPSAYLKPDVRQLSARFGWSLAAGDDGRFLLVGAPGESSAATGQNGDQTSTASAGAGAAYEFLSIGTDAWTQTRYLKAKNTEPATISTGDAFGTAVAYDEDSDTIAVSAPEEASGSFDQDDNSALGAGAVYVY